MESKTTNLTIKFTITIFGVLFCLIGGINAVKAASLYFAPSSGQYYVGNTFTVGIYVNSAKQAMNAASGDISFPADKLQIVSISKSNTILNLWVQDPSFSNTDGAAHFTGVVFTPGYTGSSGKLITINFKAKTAGDATLKFSNGSILANDGNGTAILQGMGTATFHLIEQVKPKTPTPPTKPEIIKETIPVRSSTPSETTTPQIIDTDKNTNPPTLTVDIKQPTDVSSPTHSIQLMPIITISLLFLLFLLILLWYYRRRVIKYIKK